MAKKKLIKKKNPVKRAPSVKKYMEALGERGVKTVSRKAYKNPWDYRSRHVGKPILFESPALLLEAAREYFQVCDENPWVTVDWKTEDGRLVEVEKPLRIPYTMTGYCTYLGVSSRYFDTFKREQEGKEERAEFLTAIALIEDMIRTQKFNGAAVGTFNSLIMSRDLGLVDKQDVAVNDGRKAVGDLFPDEIGDE